MNIAPDNDIAQSLSEALLLAVNGLDRGQRERAIDEAAEKADPDRLVNLISTEDPAQRNAALEALARSGQRGMPALVRALSDADHEVVMFAASTLGKTFNQAAVPYLEQLLSHPDINVRQAAIESLGTLRAASTVGSLRGLLGDDPWLRFAVVHTLGEIGDPRSASTLIDLLGDDQVREGALSALGKIGGLEVVQELVRRLEGTGSPRDFALHVRALGNALTQLADPSALRSLPFWAEFAGRAGTTVAPRLIEILGSPPSGEEIGEGLGTFEAAVEIVRCLSLRACFPALVAAATNERLSEDLLFAAADIGAPLVPYLTAGLAHQDRRIRRYCCLALAAVAFDAGGGALAKLLADPDEEIRALVVRLLARLHHTDGTAQIVERLDDQSSAVRTAAVEALCKMDAHSVSVAILRSPQQRSERYAVALAIMQANPHPLQRGFLEASLRDPRDDIRKAAIASLAAQRTTDLISVLEASLADPSLSVRRSALTALAEHPSERMRQVLLRVLERDPELRGDVIRALGGMGDDRVIPRVIGVFATCDAGQQAHAVDALGAIESPSVEPFIARQLGHQNSRVRRHAIRALARVGTSSALRRVGAALRDEDPRVRLTIAKAMASCPHPIARGALERLCLDSDEIVSAWARAQLGR